MLFTVHTSFRGKENETGIIRLWCNTEKIEAPNKAAASLKNAIGWVNERSWANMIRERGRC